MDEEDKNELDDVLENAGDDFEKPYSFLQKKVKNFNEIVKEEIQKIREESLSIAQMFA